MWLADDFPILIVLIALGHIDTALPLIISHKVLCTAYKQKRHCNLWCATVLPTLYKSSFGCCPIYINGALKWNWQFSERGLVQGGKKSQTVQIASIMSLTNKQVVLIKGHNGINISSQKMITTVRNNTGIRRKMTLKVKKKNNNNKKRRYLNSDFKKKKKNL